MKYVLGMTQYKTNQIYAMGAKKAFVDNTTSTNIKSSLRIQAFWDRVFNLPLVTSTLGTRLKKETRIPLSIEPQMHVNEWTLGRASVQSRTECSQNNESSFTIETRFKVQAGKAGNSSFYAGIALEHWNKNNFICAPGASYNGGRFKRYKTIYPPFFPEKYQQKDIPIITSEIPGLSLKENQSQMDLLISEVTSPMIGVWLQDQKRCIWLSTDQTTALGNAGFSVKEDLESGTLNIDVVTPMVRERTSSHGASAMPSWDKSRTLTSGDTEVISIHVDVLDCRSFDDFYGAYNDILSNNKQATELAPNTLPFSSSWQLIESLYNAKKWNDQYGYYHAGFLPPFIAADAWSAGWTGGLALSYALLNGGDALSKERAIRNLEFFMSKPGQSDKGIFYATSDGVHWGGDDYFANYGIGSRNWIQVRRCGDYLYFLIKHFILLEARGFGDRVKQEWKLKAQRCADALCDIWHSNQHFGQYIDPNTLDIKVGNSDAGNIIPAALAVCAGYFHRPDYMAVSEAALTTYHNDYLQKGFTAGGPLEILCAPDCESAINLLESLVVVFEETGSQHWLDKAHQYINYVRSWFYTYNVSFSEGSFYAKRGVKTTGAVLANSQNRCGVPNICTLSGDVFWKLYRYTGDASILGVIQECVHNVQQYISHPDNPITTIKNARLDDGCIHECIQTGDWAGPSGEIPYEYPTSWAEVAHLLSMCELPGIYWVTDKETLYVFDHLLARIKNTRGELTLEIENPTQYDATTTLYLESSQQMKGRLPLDIGCRMIEVQVPAGKVASVAVPQEVTVKEADLTA